jgi:uncharacterized repeat protein (TIGR03806 family)
LNGIRNFVMGKAMRREVGKGGARKVLRGVRRALPSLLIAGCSSGQDETTLLSEASEDSAPVPAFLGLPPTAADSASSPLLLSETGAFVDLARLEAAPGVLPYSVQSPLWSDGAQKRRWMALPSGTRVGYAEQGPWQFPEGTVFIKHFGMVLDERAPDDVVRLETRFLVAAQGGFYGLVYKWDDDQRDARLLLDGAEEELDIVAVDGSVRQQRYTYPSQRACGACHSERSGYVMGARTSQLDGEYTPSAGEPSAVAESSSGNQLAAWAERDVFDAPVGEAVTAHERLVPLADEAAPLEVRVRSYWDANCSSCHNEASPFPSWDARFSTPLDQQGVLLAAPRSGAAEDDVRLIVPGDAERSLIYLRSRSDQPSMRMPPLLRNRVDAAYVELLREWIESLPAG